MRAVIIYESLFGNTRAIAEAIAEGLRAQPDAEVSCVPLATATTALTSQADLLVVGAPTHMRAMSTRLTRKMGVAGERKKTPGAQVEPGFDGPGLRDWFRGLPRPAGPADAAAFDTRVGAPMAGSAAKGIARRLRRHGYRVLATEGYTVQDTQGPLCVGEIGRAREWGTTLSRQMTASLQEL